jgi:3'(2'), 5'-bisphosphate nucleotidase
MVAEESSAFLRRPEHALHLAAVLAGVKGPWPGATELSVLEAIDSPDASSPTDGAAESQGFWALDPIDGTKGYLRGQQYAVCLAYIEFGTPVVAVMGCPNLPRDFSAPLDGRDPVGTMYFAIRGDGLFETGCAGDRRDGRPVRISRLEHDPEEPITICEAVEVSRRDSQGAAAIVSHLGAGAAVLRLDSQCKYAVVARGQADAFIRLPGSGEKGDWIWDHAPGALIAAEAGCAVTDADSRLFDFSTGKVMTKNRGTVVAPGRLHGRIIAAIRELSLGTK